MGVWTIKNGHVTNVKPNDTDAKEIYTGSYENALKYFGVDGNSLEGYGKLIHLVIYHQTDDRTFKKLSSELFDILIRAQSEMKYWAPPNKRKENALNTLDQAEALGLIFDEDLKSVLRSSDRKASKNRLYMHQKWLEGL